MRSDDSLLLSTTIVMYYYQMHYTSILSSTWNFTFMLRLIIIT